jgi:anti-sigma regulatory factor (Ser/Thr protein kinase)
VEVITPAERTFLLAVDDPSQAGEVRRAATALAGRLGFDETGRGKVALVATEAATNLAKHAQNGRILLLGIESGAAVGIDLLAVDDGPGIADVGRCLLDGYSTAGSSGAGLGAMNRISSVFDMHSAPGQGTVSFCRLWSSPPTANPSEGRLDFGVVNLPLAGEEVCGDSWAIEEGNDTQTFLIVDGLGHGRQAAEAAREAVRAFRATSSRSPTEIIQASHATLRSTRGAALAVARIDGHRGEVTFAGVGNCGGVILDLIEGRSTSMVSHNGTVGHAVRKIQEFVYPWSPGGTLVLFSDGLGTHWRPDRYAGLANRHPALLAGVLYRDYQRGRDDVTVVVARDRGAYSP